jgi:hypothetical protein
MSVKIRRVGEMERSEGENYMEKLFWAKNGGIDHEF